MSDHKTIWKFVVPITDEVTTEMPDGAKVLPFIEPGDAPHTLTLWAEVFPDHPLTECTFAIVGTGNPTPDPKTLPEYITSTRADYFIWHLYRLYNPS